MHKYNDRVGMYLVRVGRQGVAEVEGAAKARVQGWNGTWAACAGQATMRKETGPPEGQIHLGHTTHLVRQFTPRRIRHSVENEHKRVEHGLGVRRDGGVVGRHLGLGECDGAEKQAAKLGLA